MRWQKCFGFTAFIAAMFLWLPAAADAQVVPPPTPPQAAPWSWQDTFAPVPFASRWEAATILEQENVEIAPEDTPVKTRQQPGYEPVGVRAGSWMFHPSLSVGGLYNSNVFATTANKQSDLALVVQPSLNLQTLWERHAIDIQADVMSQSYLNNPGLDQLNASLRARGKYDISHDAMLLTSARVARLYEAVGSLTSPQGAVKPTPYDIANGDTTYVQQFGRLTASMGLRATTYNYGSTVAQNGTPISQDSRDGQVYAGHSRIEYVFAPNLGFFGAAEVNRRELHGTPTESFNSSGYRALAGATIEFTHLLTGEIAAGYADQRFDANTIADIVGPTYRFLLKWSPTRSLDVHFKAEHAVTDVVETSTTGARADAYQMGFDYEIRRNVIFSAAAIFERDKFFGSTRKDTVVSSIAELKYMLNRYLSVSLRHQYTNRDSNQLSFVYDRHEVMLTAAAQF